MYTTSPAAASERAMGDVEEKRRISMFLVILSPSRPRCAEDWICLFFSFSFSEALDTFVERLFGCSLWEGGGQKILSWMFLDACLGWIGGRVRYVPLIWAWLVAHL